jgi:hypothetical protein
MNDLSKLLVGETKANVRSRCLYCGSLSYGKGCRFGPKGVHFHADDTTKCSYCGSPNYGKGCKMNPFSDLHLHGIPYNSMIKEKLMEYIKNEKLLNELKKPFKEYEAYELGIVDDTGRKIKEPITEQEKVAYSPYTQTLFSLKKHLGGKIDLMMSLTLLEKTLTPVYNIEKHKKFLEFESKFNEKINELIELIEESLKDGLTFEEIDDFITK